MIEEINTLFLNFLWSGKGDKIKRNTMICDYSGGVLRMIDLISFQKALKSPWVKKYLIQKITANGNTHFTGTYNNMVALPLSEATLTNMTSLNSST